MTDVTIEFGRKKHAQQSNFLSLFLMHKPTDDDVSGQALSAHAGDPPVVFCLVWRSEVQFRGSIRPRS